MTCNDLHPRCSAAWISVWPEEGLSHVQADDFVMCDECKEKTKDQKALKLHRVPEVLLIMLKRTMYPSTEKDDRHITFPLEARPFS